MKRAVGYSRYSTDLQNERSIEDQEALLKKFAANNGYQIVKFYSDAAISGASILNRDGLLDLLRDARDSKFEAVIVEELDRLSRDMADLAGIHKQMTFKGIDIVAVHEGVASTITVGLRGLVGQLFREDNSRKVRRGLEGKIRQGLSAGGIPYGYRLDPITKGLYHIVPEEAEIVLRIFQDYAAGKSTRNIAIELTREGVPATRSNRWTFSALYGWADRGTGILRNSIYAGVLTWNKTTGVKDPNTGKRVWRANPPESWSTHPLPELRIVPQELFDQVQAMIQPKVKTMTDVSKYRRPQRMLSGLLKCGACGGGMSVRGKDKSGRVRICCSRFQNSGVCSDPQTFYLDTIEDAVLSRLRKELEKPEALAVYVKEYNDARQEFAAKAIKRRGGLEKKIHDLDAALGRILKWVGEGVGDPDKLKVEYIRMNAELQEAKAELATEPAKITPVALHPAALKAYGKDLANLAQALTDRVASGYPVASEHLRKIVSSVTVKRGEKPGSAKIEVEGYLWDLLGVQTPNSGVWGPLVARGGLEPPTPRL